MVHPAALPRRVAAIDVARAVAVIGVVVNHSIDGMLGAGLIPADHPLEQVNAALYVFRMPALAFLLGLFVPRAVEKRGPLRYVGERSALMLWLYLLWFLLEGAAESAASGLKNVDRSWGRLFTFWTTFAHLWFLPFLVVATVALTALQPWRGGVRGTASLAALLGLSLLTWGWNPPGIGLTGLSLIVFAGAGSVVGVARLGALMQRSALGWTAAGAAAAAVFLLLVQLDVVPATLWEPASPAQRVLSLLAAAVGVVGLLTVAVLVSRVPGACAPLAVVGRRTLPVYLAHVVVVAGVRVLLVQAGVEEPYLIALVAVPLGVLLPLAVAVFAEPRPWASWVFDLPAPVRARLVGPAAPPPRTAVAGQNTVARTAPQRVAEPG